nr:RNA-directed DNA polymerase, eukaryota [Tanacetum cinerariifolium]
LDARLTVFFLIADMDLFGLIRAPNPTKVKTESRPRAPHELSLLTLTASRVIEMDEPAATTDSSGVPSAIEKSPLDFAEAEASGRETAALEVPLPEEVPITTVPGGDQAAPVVVEPPLVQESQKGGARGLMLMRPQSVPVDVSDPDPLAFADAASPPPADVIRSSQGVAVAGDPGSENVSSPTVVGSPGSVYRPEWGVTNGSLLDTPEACQDLVDHAAPPGYFSELRHMHNEDFLGQYNMNLARQVAMGSQLRLNKESRLGRHGLRLATMKCVESMEMRQALADVVSAGIAKGMKKEKPHSMPNSRGRLRAPCQLLPNVLGIALWARSPWPLGLQPAYAADRVPGLRAESFYVWEGGKIEKLMNAKLVWLKEKYNYRSQTHIGGSSSQTHEIGDIFLTEKELHQLHLDEEVLREILEEQAIDEKAQEDKIRQKQADDDEFLLKFKKVIEDVGEDDNFKSGAWVSATNYTNAYGGTVTGCLGDIDNNLRNKNLNKLMLDDMLLPKSDVPSRRVKQIPIKVNVLAWKISMDRLPTRVN